MVGSELAIGAAAAEGIAALITDTTKSGSSSAIGSVIKGLRNKSEQVIFQASRRYVENYQKRHCQLKVLGMREPVELSQVYTGVKLLNARDVLQYEIDAIEENFRRDRFRGYSTSNRSDQKYSGIDIANQKQYLMVLGGPGAGKSTFLRKIGLEALHVFYHDRAQYRHRLIPVLLELKRFEAEQIDIAKFIASEFETCGFPEAEKFTENALRQGNLLVLLDGLDEVPSANLNNVLTTIRDFVDRYDDNRFVASCRVAASGYRDDAFRRFSDVTMADFDDEQIQQFINNWFSSEQDVERDTAGKCWEVLQKPENKSSKELAHTPLLLTYLCLVYNLSQRFPNNRSSLYKKALRILLEEWAAEKRILRDDIYEGLSIEQEEILLSEIAYEGMVADQFFFSKRELSNQIRTFLANNLNAPKHLDSEAVLNAVEVQQGILVERAEETYSFSHLTLQEYLTAQCAIDNGDWDSLIQKYLTDSRWREIFLLLPGLMTGRSEANDFLISMERQANYFIELPNLQKLLQWAERVTYRSPNRSRPSAKRASAIFLALDRTWSITRALTRNPCRMEHLDIVSIRDFAQDLGLDLNLARIPDLDLDLDLAHTRDLNLARALACDLTRSFQRSAILSDVNLQEMLISLKLLHKEQPSSRATSTEKEKFLKKLSDLWLSTLGLSSEIVMLSKQESDSFVNYVYACELMIRCKDSAVRVSPNVWAGIESRILTVPKAS